MSECDREASITRRPWPTGSVAPWGRRKPHDDLDGPKHAAFYGEHKIRCADGCIYALRLQSHDAQRDVQFGANFTFTVPCIVNLY